LLGEAAANRPEADASRAITDQAGVAKGVLHNHFGELDNFLAEHAVDRIAKTIAAADGLQTRAGAATVRDNLTDAAVGLFGSGALTTAALMSSKPALFARVQALLASNGSGFERVERAFANYLDAEKAYDRISPDVDTEMIALTLVGSVHHLFFTAGPGIPEKEQVRRVVASIIASAETAGDRDDATLLSEPPLEL
jgi:AcrR family transcriptional regulator